jgi:hypothetical protein
MARRIERSTVPKEDLTPLSRIARVRQVRRREDGRDWEVRMQSPVNRILPVSREGWETLRKALGEG